MQVGRLDYLAHRRIADATGGIVDDTPDGLFIVRVHHHAEVSYHVFYLLSLIEAESAIDAIRDAILAHLLLKTSTLGVGPVQYGEVRILSVLLFPYSLDVIAHYHGLLLVAVCGLERQTVTLLIFAENILVYLPLVLTYQAVGSLHDELCRAVVLLQLIQPRILVLLLEVQNIVDISPAEAVDTLRIVAHHAHLSVLLCQLKHDSLLGIVRVLILIDQHITETLGILSAYVLMLSEQHVRLYQQVVKIHGVSLAATLGVTAVDGCHLRPLMMDIVGSPRTGGVCLWQQQVVLGHRDTVAHRSRLIHLVVQLHLLDDALQQRA